MTTSSHEVLGIDAGIEQRKCGHRFLGELQGAIDTRLSNEGFVQTSSVNSEDRLAWLDSVSHPDMHHNAHGVVDGLPFDLTPAPQGHDRQPHLIGSDLRQVTCT